MWKSESFSGTSLVVSKHMVSWAYHVKAWCEHPWSRSGWNSHLKYCRLCSTSLGGINQTYWHLYELLQWQLRFLCSRARQNTRHTFPIEPHFKTLHSCDPHHEQLHSIYLRGWSYRRVNAGKTWVCWEKIRKTKKWDVIKNVYIVEKDKMRGTAKK